MKIITGCNGFIGKKFAEQDEVYWNGVLELLPITR